MVVKKNNKLEIEKAIKKIKNMNLSEPFLYEINNLENDIKNEKYEMIDCDVDNIYYNIKREEISDEDKEFLKAFLFNILERNVV